MTCSVTSTTPNRCRRVIESRMCLESGGVTQRVAVQRADEGHRRALEHAPVRGHEQRVVGALFLGHAAGELFAP